jgi:hypothetical protein
MAMGQSARAGHCPFLSKATNSEPRDLQGMMGGGVPLHLTKENTPKWPLLVRTIGQTLLLLLCPFPPPVIFQPLGEPHATWGDPQIFSKCDVGKSMWLWDWMIL